MIYSFVLLSTKHHHESAIGLPMSPPTWTTSHLSPYPTSLDCYRVQVWVSPLSHTFPLAVYFTYSNVCFHVTLSGPSPFFSLVSLAKGLWILFYLFKDLILSFIYLSYCFFSISTLIILISFLLLTLGFVWSSFLLV